MRTLWNELEKEGGCERRGKVRTQMSLSLISMVSLVRDCGWPCRWFRETECTHSQRRRANPACMWPLQPFCYVSSEWSLGVSNKGRLLGSRSIWAGLWRMAVVQRRSKSRTGKPTLGQEVQSWTYEEGPYEAWHPFKCG